MSLEAPRRARLFLAGSLAGLLATCVHQVYPQVPEGAQTYSVRPAPAGAAPEVERLVQELQGPTAVSKVAMTALIRRGESVTPHALPLLENRSWGVRWRAVNVLGSIRDPRGIEGLARRALTDDNPHVRWRSLWALARTEPDGATTREIFARDL